MKAGFIGLGRMGTGMAARLLAAGQDLLVFNRSPGKTKPLVEQGAQAARSIRDFLRVDVVFTMLADDPALESVVYGDPGLLGVLKPGAIHVSCSTISVDCADRLSKAHSERGQEFVSAPVFGRPEAASAGQLFLVLAGKRKILDRLEPLLTSIGQRNYIVSEDPTRANLVKLSGNFLIASVIECLGEAMALVEKGGIDRHAYLDLITSSIFDLPLYKNYGNLIADRKFHPMGFAAPLGQKDIRLLLQAAESLDVPLPVASLLRDRFIRLSAESEEPVDWSAIGVLPAKDAGLAVHIGGEKTSD